MLHLSVPRLPPLYLPPRARVKVTAVVSGTPLSPISPPLGSCQERRPAVGPPVAVIVTPALGLWAPLGSTAGGSNRMEVEMKPCSVLRGQDIVITFQRRGDHSATPLPIGHALDLHGWKKGTHRDYVPLKNGLHAHALFVAFLPGFLALSSIKHELAAP